MDAWGIPPLYLNDPHPHLFPHPTKFKEYITRAGPGSEHKFKYLDVSSMASTNITFITQVESLSEDLVIKFVEQYSVKAHKLLAGKRMAPQLLYCGLLDGEHNIRQDGSGAQGGIKSSDLYVDPVLMATMKHLEGHTVNKEPVLPKDTHEQIKKAIKKLHTAGFVFWDLKASSIMISGRKVFFIAFNRVGQERKGK